MTKSRKEPIQAPRAPLIVVDVDDSVLGRAASKIAKMLLEGNRVVVLNSEKAIITGKPRSIVDDYKNRHQIKTATNPRRGPFTQKQPDRLVRRTVRGMLPIKKSSGKAAFKRLMAYIGVPDEFAEMEAIKIPEASSGTKVRRFVKVERISNEFGWTEKGKR